MAVHDKVYLTFMVWNAFIFLYSFIKALSALARKFNKNLMVFLTILFVIEINMFVLVLIKKILYYLDCLCQFNTDCVWIDVTIISSFILIFFKENSLHYFFLLRKWGVWYVFLKELLYHYSTDYWMACSLFVTWYALLFT